MDGKYSISVTPDDVLAFSYVGMTCLLYTSQIGLVKNVFPVIPIIPLIPLIIERSAFDLLSQMLYTLKDGHVNLSSAKRTSFYDEWYQEMCIRDSVDNGLRTDLDALRGHSHIGKCQYVVRGDRD